VTFLSDWVLAAFRALGLTAIFASVVCTGKDQIVPVPGSFKA
jgi:hypothetical protein